MSCTSSLAFASRESSIRSASCHRVECFPALGLAWAALAAGATLAQVAEGLGRYQPVGGRMERVALPRNVILINDTYNANPASLYAGMSVLAGSGDETWLVLGDMAELGEKSDKLHAEVGQAAADLGIRRLFGLGPHSSAAVRAFGSGGDHFESRERLIEVLRGELRPGVFCLVKGSRSMGMEKVVSALTGGGE